MIIVNSDLKNFSKDNLYIITDFDKTLTSSESESTIGVFLKFLPEEYINVKNEITKLENYLTNEFSLDEKEKKHYYRYIWMLKLRLLSSYLKDENIIKEIVYSNEFIMRDGAIETLNYLKNKYKVIINSSGCGNLIKEILIKSGCDIRDIKIVSNYIDIGSNNPLDEDNIINSSQKTNNFYDKLTSNIKNCLIIGDTLEDLTMRPMNASATSIGFLDCDYEIYLNKFKESFDIVATNNESYDAPIKILNL